MDPQYEEFAKPLRPKSVKQLRLLAESDGIRDLPQLTDREELIAEIYARKTGKPSPIENAGPPAAAPDASPSTPSAAAGSPAPKRIVRATRAHWRAGRFFTLAKEEFALDEFSPEQWAAIEKDPWLKVK